MRFLSIKTESYASLCSGKMQMTAHSRREMVRYLEHARELYRRVHSVCLCCSKIFVVQNEGQWQCYFCAKDNTSAWKCCQTKKHHDTIVEQQQKLCSMQGMLLTKLEKDALNMVKEQLVSLQNVNSPSMVFSKGNCKVVLTIKPNVHSVEASCNCDDCLLVKLPFTVLSQRLQRLAILNYKFITQLEFLTKIKHNLPSWV